MSQWLIVAFDVVSCIAFAVAFVVTLTLPLREFGSYGRTVRLFLALAIAVYAFVGVSNVLEHAGVTAVLDAYEDYCEILFVPLVAYALFVVSIARRESAIRHASELARAEHDLLNAIVETSPSGIMLVAPSGDIAFANDRGKDLLGLRSDSETGSLKLPADLICTSTVSASDRPLDLARLASGEVFDSAVCVVEVDGRRVALSVSASPLSAADGTQQGSVVAFVDVTEREQARQDLLDAQARYSLDLERTVDERTVDLFALNRELERANRARQEFLTRANRELRTPLNAIVGVAGLLLSGATGQVSAEQGAQVTVIKDSGEQLLTLMDRMLDMGRVESGHAVVELAETDLSGLLAEMADLVAPLAKGRGVSMAVESTPGITLVTDADLLIQVVRNLLSNAVKFTDAGGSVTLSSRTEGDSVLIAVTDTGIGIPADEQERVFHAFAQVPSAQSDRPKGTGLGLAICSDLVAALGGRIDLTSTIGVGSTFTVELPLRAPGA